jgi:hypothetical protein
VEKIRNASKGTVILPPLWNDSEIQHLHGQLSTGDDERPPAPGEALVPGRFAGEH